MSLPLASHAYVAFRRCGHPIMVVVDDPQDLDETARAVAQMVRGGYWIGRLTLDEAREVGVAYCSCVPTLEDVALAVYRRSIYGTAAP